VKLTTEQAILRLRADPACVDLIRDGYLGADVRGNAQRFFTSGEFAAVRDLVGPRLRGALVLDVGAGTGIASVAFARSGARAVVALEPDPSAVVGYGAMREILDDLRVSIVSGFGETFPFRDGSFDVVYTRQVLHHARDLEGLLRECARVVAKGGVVIATREHVVDDAAQLAAFLEAHPVHRLAGGENAFPLASYVAAFRGAGLGAPRVLGPLDTVVNAYPGYRDEAEVRDIPRRALARRLGALGTIASRVPGANALVRRMLDRREPGRLYSFVAGKR
jgi:SAM-dependent methyltransferase